MGGRACSDDVMTFSTRMHVLCACFVVCVRSRSVTVLECRMWRGEESVCGRDYCRRAYRASDDAADDDDDNNGLRKSGTGSESRRHARASARNNASKP